MIPWLVACAAEPEDTGSPAPDGTTTAAPVELALEQMPPCEPGSNDGRLDVTGACADGVCLGTTYAEAVDLLGPTTCVFIVDGSTCFFDSLVISFRDDDADGVPNDDATAYSLAANAPWDGGTAEGLALDATLRCFVDVLGTPSAVSFGSYPEGWLVRTLAWDPLFFSVYDFGDGDQAGAPDGLPDFVQFTNYLFY
jgi:hypothetical protein